MDRTAGAVVRTARGFLPPPGKASDSPTRPAGLTATTKRVPCTLSKRIEVRPVTTARNAAVELWVEPIKEYGAVGARKLLSTDRPGPTHSSFLHVLWLTVWTPNPCLPSDNRSAGVYRVTPPLSIRHLAYFLAAGLRYASRSAATVAPPTSRSGSDAS